MVDCSHCEHCRVREREEKDWTPDDPDELLCTLSGLDMVHNQPLDACDFYKSVDGE
jgi:hypothetical protein